MSVAETSVAEMSVAETSVAEMYGPWPKCPSTIYTGVFPFRLLPFRLLPFRLFPFRLLSKVKSVLFRLLFIFFYFFSFFHGLIRFWDDQQKNAALSIVVQLCDETGTAFIKIQFLLTIK